MLADALFSLSERTHVLPLSAADERVGHCSLSEQYLMVTGYIHILMFYTTLTTAMVIERNYVEVFGKRLLSVLKPVRWR